MRLWHLCCHCVGYWLSCGAITTSHVSFKHVQLLPLTNQHCVHQRSYSHLSRHSHCQPNKNGFIFPILCHPRICCFQCGSSQRTELLQPTPRWSIPPLSNRGIWMSTLASGHVFTQLCQCHLEFKRTRTPSFFCLGYFSSAKNFNHIAEAASILHLKSTVAVGMITSWLPPLHDTSPIFMADLLQVPDFWYGKIRPTYCKQLIFDMDRFWHLIWSNLTSYKFSIFFFSFFLSLCTFS